MFSNKNSRIILTLPISLSSDARLDAKALRMFYLKEDEREREREGGEIYIWIEKERETEGRGGRERRRMSFRQATFNGGKEGIKVR